MRFFWMTCAMTVAAVAACSETHDATESSAGTGGGGSDAGSSGTSALGGKPSAQAGAAGTVSAGATPTDSASGGGAQAGAAGSSAGAAGSSVGGGDDGGAGGDDSGGAPGWQLRALTYNTALAPDFEPFTQERKPQIQSALATAAKQLDLLCVQEYWQGSDFDDLKTAVAADLSHPYRQAPKPGTGSCSQADLGELGGCLGDKCAGKQGLDLVECAQTECAQAIEDVDGGCLGCFLDHLDDTNFGACTASAPSDPALFGGTFDVGLLSRYPLSQQAALEYDAYFVRASALYAQVDVPGLGPVDTFCTHLGSSLGVIPYHGPHGSWDGEHAYQIAQLLGFVSAKASGAHPVLVLGDLNTGPESAGPPPISAELPLDYQLLLGSGLASAVAAPKCTLCSDNVLRGAGSREIWLDHALIKGFSGSAQAERALTSTFMLGAAPNSTPMNLSDHYGLRVELRSE